jgi:hypothetical protein
MSIQVRKYSKDEKFIIFSSGPLTLAHVADGLTLLGTRFLQLSTGQTKNGKEHILTTFKTSEDIRVLLMELKVRTFSWYVRECNVTPTVAQYGARGLNITEASRIIFCEPVWGLDVESQAIKVLCTSSTLPRLCAQVVPHVACSPHRTDSSDNSKNASHTLHIRRGNHEKESAK